MPRPESANFVLLWLMYREERRVFVQQFLLMLDECKEAFDPDDPYTHVPPRETTSEDGDAISEWETDVAKIAEFLETGP